MAMTPAAEAGRDEPIIEFRDVTKRFGGRLAVDRVSFALRDGVTLGIVGQSGSGKTTTLRMAIGLEKASDGVITYRGRPYPSGRRRLRAIRRHIGYVFQDPYDSLDPRRTIGETIAEPLRIHGVGRREATARARSALASVGMEDIPLDSYPSRYSGGGRQRIAIARALILDPAVLLCDEPTASLDVSVQAQIINLLLDLRAERNLSMIFVSHDLDLVRCVATEAVVMYAGRVMERGPVDEVVDAPCHPYTRALVASIPADHPARRKLVGEDVSPPPAGPVPTLAAAGCPYAAHCSRATDECRSTDPPRRLEGQVEVACFHPLRPGEPVPAAASEVPQ